MSRREEEAANPTGGFEERSLSAAGKKKRGKFFEKACHSAVCGQPSFSRYAMHSKRHCQVRDPEPSLAPYVLGFRATKGTGSNFTTGKTGRNTQLKRWNCACGWDRRGITKQHCSEIASTVPRVITSSPTLPKSKTFLELLPTAQHCQKTIRNRSQKGRPPGGSSPS